jgi:cobalt-zinc-cadmium efflux system outer membrane protein
MVCGSNMSEGFMLSLHKTGVSFFIFVFQIGGASGQDLQRFTLQDVLAKARERAPAARAARARIDEARARLATASLFPGGNPIFEASAGRRTSHGEKFTDLDIGITQPLGAMGIRQSRMASARAALSAEVSASEDVERRLVQDAADAFTEALHAAERHRHIRASEALAEDIRRVAERRLQAGDVAMLDLNVASAALARARSETLSAEGALNAAVGKLRILLGLAATGPFEIQGELNTLPAFELPDLLREARNRADIRVLSAQMEHAEAEGRLAATLRRPEFDVGLRYEEEEEAEIIMGGLAVTLPVFDRGQGVRAEAGSRLARLRMEHDALVQTVDAEVRSAFETYQHSVRAASALEAILPTLSESEKLASRSYEAGQISLVDSLLVRRDVMETRLSHLDRLLDASIARVRLLSSAGVLR